MPMRHLPEGIANFDSWFGTYPLLVFPVRVFNRGASSGALTPRPEECNDCKPYRPCHGVHNSCLSPSANGAPR